MTGNKETVGSREGREGQLLKLEKVALFRIAEDGVSSDSACSGLRVFPPSSDSGATSRG
jgi:hypothetical protein